MDNNDVDKKLATEKERSINRIKNMQNDIIWQKNPRIKQKMVAEIKREKSILIQMATSDLKIIEEKLRDAKTKQSEVLDEQMQAQKVVNYQIKNLKIKVNSEKLEKIAADYEIEYLSQYEEVGITIEDFDQDLFVASKYIKKPKVEMNIETGEYTLTDKNGKKITQKVSTELMEDKAKEKFVNDILGKYARSEIKNSISDEVKSKMEVEFYLTFREKAEISKEELEQYTEEYMINNSELIADAICKEMEAHRKQFELIGEFVDINLYNFYHEYNPSYANMYLVALDLEDGSFMPTDLEYDKEKVTYIERAEPTETQFTEAEEIDENQPYEEIYEFKLPSVEEEKETPKVKLDIETIKSDEYIDLNAPDDPRINLTTPRKETINTKPTHKVREELYSKKYKKELRKKAKQHAKLGIASIKRKDRGFKKFWQEIASKLGIKKRTLALAEGKMENVYKMENPFKESLSEKVEPLDYEAISKKQQQTRGRVSSNQQTRN